MTKLMTAMIAAGLCAGFSAANARDMESAAERDWATFQTADSSGATDKHHRADNTSGNTEAVKDGSKSAEEASKDPAGSNATGRRNRDSTQQHSDVTPGAGAGPDSNAANQPGSQTSDNTSTDTQSNTSQGSNSSAGDDASGREDNRRNRESTMQNEPGGPAVESGQSTTGQPGQAGEAGAAGDPSDEIRNRDSRKQQQGTENTPPEPTTR